MNRLEKFRYIRNIRRRNRLQFHEQAYEPYGDTHYYIRFLNEDIYINVKYIKEDIKKLKNWLSRIF